MKMIKTLIAITLSAFYAINVIGAGIIEPRNITYTGSNVFNGVLIGSGTNLTDLNLNPSLSQTVAKASIAATNSAYYAGSTTYVSNNITYIGTNGFGGGVFIQHDH
jgi:hypothetical protein